MTVCTALLRSGTPCRNPAKHEGVCGRHMLRHNHEHKEVHKEDLSLKHKEDCAVCLEPIKTRAQQTTLNKCDHKFHKRCIRSWLGKGILTCPVCRAPCIHELRALRGCMARKVKMLVRTLPPPPGSYFPTYIIGLLTSPTVQHALDIDDDAVQCLIDLAYIYGTEHLFFKYLHLNSS